MGRPEDHIAGRRTARAVGTGIPGQSHGGTACSSGQSVRKLPLGIHRCSTGWSRLQLLRTIDGRLLRYGSVLILGRDAACLLSDRRVSEEKSVARVSWIHRPLHISLLLCQGSRDRFRDRWLLSGYSADENAHQIRL